jgi:hypothetical protein
MYYRDYLLDFEKLSAASEEPRSSFSKPLQQLLKASAAASQSLCSSFSNPGAASQTPMKASQNPRILRSGSRPTHICALKSTPI